MAKLKVVRDRTRLYETSAGGSNDTMIEDVKEKGAWADDLIREYTAFSAAAGFIPSPIVDVLTVSGIQLNMLSKICDIYHVSFSNNKGKTIISALAGGVTGASLSTGMAGSLLKVLPVVGPIVGGYSMSIFCGAATFAMGKIFKEHFEAGGSFFDLDDDAVKEKFKNKMKDDDQTPSE